MELQRGEHDRAERTLTGVLSMVRRSRDVIGEGHLLRNLGEVHWAAGRYDQARRAFEQALAVREQIMDQGGAAAVRLDLARLLARTGSPTRAGELLEHAVETFRERGMRHELGAAEGLLAEIAAGDPRR
jgi:tetratricopeptide (TPR) repeat protein